MHLSSTGSSRIRSLKTPCKTILEITEGMRFDKGYISPYFVTDAKCMEASFEEPVLLITDKKIALVQELVPVLEQVARSGRPLIIIAEDIEKEALATLVVNCLRGVLNVAAIKSPAHSLKIGAWRKRLEKHRI